MHGKGETQEIVRRLLLDAPVSGALVPVLWHLAATGRVEDRVAFLTRLASAPIDAKSLPRWHRLARDPEKAVREKVLAVLAQHDTGRLGRPLRGAARRSSTTRPSRCSSGRSPAPRRGRGRPSPTASCRSWPRARPPRARSSSRSCSGCRTAASVVRRYIVFSKTLAGWARDRALESMRAFGNDLLEPTIELLSDPDQEVRASAMLVAQSFEDARIVPATIGLLKDPDWWIRITAAETLGRLKDPRGVPPLVEALSDPETRWSAVEALGRIGDLRAVPGLSELLQDPAPEVRIEVIQALSHFEHPQMLDFVRNVARQDPSRAVRARAFEITCEMAARTPDEARRRGRAQAGGARREVRRRRAEAQRAAGGHPQQRRLRLPPLGRPAAGDPARRRPRARPGRAVHGRADRGHGARDPDRRAVGEAAAGAASSTSATTSRPPAATAPTSSSTSSGMNGVFRVIPERPPTIAEIGLPAHLAEIADYHQGLVIVCGPVGLAASPRRSPRS